MLTGRNCDHVICTQNNDITHGKSKKTPTKSNGLIIENDVVTTFRRWTERRC